ncbi:MAG: histone deacetylase 3 [Amphiamblys sp. WSBS2006]|nr:MAG: histone deacetylase 3 [Amphiamblys sp. WSBS2006]
MDDDYIFPKERKVAYFFNEKTFNYHYGKGQPMKPHRLALTHSLVLEYGMHTKMRLYRTQSATFDELCAFHTKEYVGFLARASETPTSVEEHEIAAYTLTPDTPIFGGVYDFCSSYSGSSLSAARHLCSGSGEDIAVNWSGGFHHGRKIGPYGFCYVNDIVLAIIELLKHHERVLYIDIDIHHGDGVQDAFYTTDRVMTISFHKHAPNFFPGTGAPEETGVGDGTNHSINVPLGDGIDDHGYAFIFQPAIRCAVETYRPGAIVMQCGADCLAEDKLGAFNLSIKGHGECLAFVKSLGIPLLVVGGGGYTTRNVARCWTYDTSVLLETPLSDTIPDGPYAEYFEPGYKLHSDLLPTIENKNTRKSLEQLRKQVLETIRRIG